MSTTRLQVSSLRLAKFGLFYFPTDGTLEQAKTSQVIEGPAKKGSMVQIRWNKEHPILPAKVMALSGK